MTADRRLLFVHAHPDDEVIGSGATMAKYAAEGAHVALVTCTLGEEGEILVPGLVHLASDKEDALGEHRIGELAAAMKAVGVTDHRFLGGPGRWRDSGMMGTPANERPDCFWQADLDEAVGDLVAVMPGHYAGFVLEEIINAAQWAHAAVRHVWKEGSR